MKKSIGLTANTSDFRPSLPQTRHLNYFMGTNPVYMAGGGDVKAGIPNYPDVNVTRGFLPAALGFVEGGEADKDTVTKIYDFIFGYFKNVFGLDDDEAKKKTEETIKDPNKIEEIIKIVKPSDRQPGLDVPLQPLIPSDRQPGLDTVTPIDTVTEIPKNTIPGGYYGAPPAISQTTPGIGPRLETSPGLSTGAPVTPIAPKADEVWPPQKGGITEIKPEKEKKYKFLDLNKDGVVDGKDLEIARNNPLYGWAIKLIEGIIGGFDDLKPDEPVIPKPDEQIIAPKADEIWPTPTEPITTDGGIAKLPIVSEEQKLREKEDKWTGLGVEEQKLLKKASAIADGEDPNKGGITDKKDVPAWALPLMSAGFAMMASKSPYFLQALGEGGEKGIETYAAQEEGKLTKRKTEAEIKKAEAMAEWYSGGGAGGKPTIITDNETGRRVYAIFNKKTKQYDIIKKADNTPLYAVRSNEEIDKYLSDIHLTWATMPEDEKNKYRQQEKDRDLGIALTNVASGTEEDKGPGIFGKVWKGLVEGVTKEKDGGIVSLRK